MKRASEIPLNRWGRAAAIGAGVATPLAAMYGFTQLMGHGLPWLANQMRGGQVGGGGVGPPVAPVTKVAAYAERMKARYTRI